MVPCRAPIGFPLRGERVWHNSSFPSSGIQSSCSNGSKVARAREYFSDFTREYQNALGPVPCLLQSATAAATSVEWICGKVSTKSRSKTIRHLLAPWNTTWSPHCCAENDCRVESRSPLSRACLLVPTPSINLISLRHLIYAFIKNTALGLQFEQFSSMMALWGHHCKYCRRTSTLEQHRVDWSTWCKTQSKIKVLHRGENGWKFEIKLFRIIHGNLVRTKSSIITIIPTPPCSMPFSVGHVQ